MYKSDAPTHKSSEKPYVKSATLKTSYRTQTSVPDFSQQDLIRDLRPLRQAWPWPCQLTKVSFFTTRHGPSEVLMLTTKASRP